MAQAEIDALKLDNTFLREKQKVLEVMQSKLEQNSRLMTSTTQVLHDYDSTLASRKKVFDMELESAEDIVQKRGEEVDMLKQLIRSQEHTIRQHTGEMAALKAELVMNGKELVTLRGQLEDQILTVEGKQDVINELNENMVECVTNPPMTSVLEHYVDSLSCAMESFIGIPQGVS